MIGVIHHLIFCFIVDEILFNKGNIGNYHMKHITPFLNALAKQAS